MNNLSFLQPAIPLQLAMRVAVSPPSRAVFEHVQAMGRWEFLMEGTAEALFTNHRKGKGEVKC